MDMQLIKDAVAYACTHESKMDRDIGAALEAGHFEDPIEFAATIGPVKPRGGPCGMIYHRGRLITQWGDPARVDMTFSVSKSYLALLAGLAVEDGLIPDIHAPVRASVAIEAFESTQNQGVTWAQLLTLTSEWEGTLWGKPDSMDHHRDLDGTNEGPAKGTKRVMQANGTFWEYNDVRVNVLALALLHVFKRPLPKVLKERIMDPIGASKTWEWHGYSNSTVTIAGQPMQSVSGGAHWGGGLWISAQDHALVGMLMLNRGLWQGKQLVSADWVDACRAPCPLNPQYGLLWWLNTGRDFIPAATEASYFGLGVGSQVLWIDPDNEMVAVVRWIEKTQLAEFGQKVMQALTK